MHDLGEVLMVLIMQVCRVLQTVKEHSPLALWLAVQSRSEVSHCNVLTCQLGQVGQRICYELDAVLPAGSVDGVHLSDGERYDMLCV